MDKKAAFGGFSFFILKKTPTSGQPWTENVTETQP